MRHFAFFITFLLALQACAPMTPQAAPEADPVKSEAPKPDAQVDKKTATATYANSVIAAIWHDKPRGNQLTLVEPSTGEPVPGYSPIQLGMNYYHSFSPDGQSLAVISYKSETSLTGLTLHLIDLANWKDSPIELEVRGWASGLTFSPDGKYLAAGFNDRKGTLLVFDLEKKSVLAETPVEFDISRLKFTTDNSSLMAYGHVILNRATEREMTSGPAKAVLFDAQDLTTRWSADLEGVRDGIYPSDENATTIPDLSADPDGARFLYPGLVFAPDQDSLYVLHADEEKLTTVDFEARSMQTVSIQPKLSWFEQFLMIGADTAYAKVANGTFRNAVISADGKAIYTIGTQNQTSILSSGDWEVTQIPLGFQVIDPADGSLLLELDTMAGDLGISPDGSLVFVQNWVDAGWPSTQIFDVKTGEFSKPIKNAYLRPIRRMDGTLILVSSTMSGGNQSSMKAYSVDGILLGEWTVIDYSDWLTAQ